MSEQETEFEKKLSHISNVFSPSAPIVSRELFFGRLDQVARVMEAEAQRGMHAIIYGERGVGKTSLANVISEMIGHENLISKKITCTKDASFDSIWQNVLAKIKFISRKEKIGFNDEYKQELRSIVQAFPNGEIKPIDIINVFENLELHLLLIFDEFDAVENKKIKQRFAETIKGLSDNSSSVTILIVGVAESVEKLIGAHKSLERCLRQIKMPLMSNSELKEIVENGMSNLEIQIPEKVTNRVVKLSQGFPHYTHLLSKFLAEFTVYNSTDIIEKGFLKRAVDKAIENANQTIKSKYQKAILTSREKSKFKDILSACAIVKTNSNGTFKTKDLIPAYEKITGERKIVQSFTYNLGKLCQKSRGNVLEKTTISSKQVRFGFKNPLLKAFIILNLHKEGILKY